MTRQRDKERRADAKWAPGKPTAIDHVVAFSVVTAVCAAIGIVAAAVLTNSKPGRGV